MARDDCEFHRGGCSKIIEHDRNSFFRAEVAVLQNLREQRLSQLVRWLNLRSLHARLAVNAEAEFHLVFAQFKTGLAYSGRGSS